MNPQHTEEMTTTRPKFQPHCSMQARFNVRNCGKIFSYHKFSKTHLHPPFLGGSSLLSQVSAKTSRDLAWVGLPPCIWICCPSPKQG